jgi:peptide/nickel transport system substrate-binding protein
MSHPPRPASLSLARFVALTLLVLVAVGWLTLSLMAQGKKKEEEEDKTPPPAKTKPKPKVEEEDTTPAAKPTHGVTPSAEAGKGAPKSDLGDLGDLVTAARQARNPAVKQFLEDVAVPHDIIVTGRGLRPVAPVEKYLGEDPPRFAGSIKVNPLNEKFEQEKDWNVTSGMLTAVKYYERIALDRVDEFLASGLDRDPSDKVHYVPRQEMLRYAEAVLASVQRFHESQVQQGKRGDDPAFAAMEADIKRRLLGIQLDRLNQYVTDRDWDNAFTLANRLADAYPKPEDHKKIAEVLARVIAKAAQAAGSNDQKLLDLQRRLKQIEDRFPDSTALVGINNRLKEEAESMFLRARDLVEKPPERKKEALELLRRAEEVYPRLPGLRDYRLKLENALAVLRVGVRELPVNLSPNLAYTDAEKQAVDLLFEGLVKVSYDPGVGQYYTPGLAEGRPLVLPCGRTFHIAREAFWSNDKPVTAADVRNTLDLLRNPKWTGYDPSWKELIDTVRLDTDPSRITILLKQGVFDPLSLMTFKVLPSDAAPNHPLTPDEEESFAKHPVGSGPYQLQPAEGDDPGRVVTFAASPSYGSRAGKAGLPHIRQVQFVKCDDPVRALYDGVVDLVTDVPTPRVSDLQKAGSRIVLTQPMPSRRIWFLAVNCRMTALQNEGMRNAIAHAIDREAILNTVFRAGQKDLHRALTGPFPPGSWACDPNHKYNIAVAKSMLKDADRAAAFKQELSLKYPAGDAQIENAVKMIRDQVKAELGMTLKLEALPAQKLREAVEYEHRYDLAYYHYDYPSDAFNLWPLFDPDATGPRQSNYLGYGNDGELLQQFGIIRSRRDPRMIQEATRTLDKVVFKKMPLIPLWQLDTQAAMSSAVQPTAFDPLLIFNDIDRWRLERK